MLYAKSPTKKLISEQSKTTAPVFQDQRASSSMQLKQQQMMWSSHLGNGIVQRAAKWWATNAEHTTISGGELSSPPESGTYVKREKAGASDELFSTEADAWEKAKGVSLSNRSENTELFPDTTEKMVSGDGNRTYLTKPESTKAVSIVVTHTTDPQSVLTAEDDTKLKVRHTHSTFAKHTDVKKAIKAKTVPAYSNSDEAKVHYLSLTPQ